MNDRLVKTHSLLKAKRKHAEAHSYYWEDVSAFNDLLKVLSELDIDVECFYINRTELNQNTWSGGNLPPTHAEAVPCMSKADYLTKLDGVLGFLDTLPKEEVKKVGTVDLVEICQRFGDCARQLTKRHDNRPIYEIKDEYDVQDLLHAILRLHFDDVRAEEQVSSFANKSSRTDFYLPEIKTFVEVKYYNKKRSVKKLRTEIIDDVASYSAHHGCEALIVLIHEGDDRIENPKGFRSDLEQLKLKENPIRVIITH